MFKINPKVRFQTIEFSNLEELKNIEKRLREYGYLKLNLENKKDFLVLDNYHFHYCFWRYGKEPFNTENFPKSRDLEHWWKKYYEKIV